MEHTLWDTDDGDQDPDTDLILAYLSNKLSPADAALIQERGRQEQEFRRKVAELVLLKGLVTLALGPEHVPVDSECKRIRAMFPAYLKGEASPSVTAKLSRHLEKCLDCDIQLETLRNATLSETPTEEGWWARLRRTTSRLSRWRPWGT